MNTAILCLVPWCCFQSNLQQIQLIHVKTDIYHNLIGTKTDYPQSTYYCNGSLMAGCVLSHAHVEVAVIQKTCQVILENHGSKNIKRIKKEHSFVQTAKLRMDSSVLTAFGQTSLGPKSALLSLHFKWAKHFFRLCGFSQTHLILYFKPQSSDSPLSSYNHVFVSSLNGFTALRSWSQHINVHLILLQYKRNSPDVYKLHARFTCTDVSALCMEASWNPSP